MSDWLALFAVAAGVYLLECCTSVRSATTVCCRGLRSRVWQVARGTDLPGNHSGGAVLASPFHLTGSVVIPGDWPLSISPRGVANVPAAASYIDSRRSRFIDFKDVWTINSQLDEVRINGRPFIQASSSALAAHL